MGTMTTAHFVYHRLLAALGHQHCLSRVSNPHDKVRRYLVYLKYWTLNLRPLMVYPKVLFPPNFIIQGQQEHLPCIAAGSSPGS